MGSRRPDGAAGAAANSRQGFQQPARCEASRGRTRGDVMGLHDADARDDLYRAWDNAETVGPEDPAGMSETGRLKLVMFDEIKPRLTSNYIVKGVLGDGEMGVVYGESGGGKTFFALDLALHVAAGKEWRGRRVRQGGVVYVAAEGGHGINNRVVAFKRHRDVQNK